MPCRGCSWGGDAMQLAAVGGGVEQAAMETKRAQRRGDRGNRGADPHLSAEK